MGTLCEAFAMEAPTKRSYWVDTRVLAGKYPGDKLDQGARAKVRSLLDAGVRTFVDLTEENELLPYARFLPDGVTHHRVAVRDVTCPSADQVRDALDQIEEGAERGIVYVHCRGGCGRTGVVIGCYLVEQGLDPEEALGRVKELTGTIFMHRCPETPEQIDMVRRWMDLRHGG